MYTSYIGKKFLHIYNEKTSQNLSAREFFDNIFFPLFFDDEKHLMHVGNSPFFQSPSAKALEGGVTKSQAQLAKLHLDINSEAPNMAIFVGFAAKDMSGTTSGQLSNIDFKIDAEEMYASWFGEALGIGVSGGYVMLLDEDEILWTLFEGWKIYRSFLKQTPNLKDKQIETWNGRWITHVFSKDFNPKEPIENFQLAAEQVLGKLAIPTQSWSGVVFALSRKYPLEIFTAYAYNLSQTNTTLGFINLFLPEVRKPFELRDKIFINKQGSVLTDGDIMRMETYYNFKGACKLGTIGLKAMEPDKLRDYLPAPFGRGKEYSLSSDVSYKLLEIYKIWIIAMLNKTELNVLAAKMAQALWDFEQRFKDNERGKAGKSQLAEDVRTSSSLTKFIESLNKVMEKDNTDAIVFKETKDQILKMPSDLFPLFVTLLRFEYTYLKTQNK